MDSPGLFDTTKTDDQVSSDVIQAVACMEPGPTAVLHVISAAARYTEEDKSVYDRLKALFDLRVTQYMIVIFTGGDVLKKKKMSIEDALATAPEALHQVLEECDNRYVVFDNAGDDKQPQLDDLFKLVDKVNKVHGDKPYTCPKYSHVREKMEKEVARRLQEVEMEEAKRIKFVQELEEKMKQVKEEAEKAKREFEKREKEKEQEIRKREEERRKQLEIMVDALSQQKLQEEKKKEKEQMDKIQQKLQEEKKKEKEQMDKMRKDYLDALQNQEHETRKIQSQLEEMRRKAEGRQRSYQTEVLLLKEQVTMMQQLKEEIAKKRSLCVIQ